MILHYQHSELQGILMGKMASTDFQEHGILH